MAEKTIRLKTVTRLLVGFAGSNTILENSLSLHPYYGFPIIYGSTIKGVTRHFCKVFKKIPDTELLEIFGNEPESKNASEGGIVFLDAIPSKIPSEGIYELDVMTPHYPEYYSLKEYPTDTQSPNPIIFLAIKKGVEFIFPLRTSRNCKDRNLIDKASEYLIETLQTIGIGAKTSSSYGYFESIKFN